MTLLNFANNTRSKTITFIPEVECMMKVHI